ncbi:MAG: DUF4361 domain-containing protein [Prevotella sp.]|nr:DUF4361 domain-containing protein [Prevotella sp.]
MKKNILNIITGLAGASMLLVMTACGEKEFYDDEQYRKECYIVSGDNNIFGQEYVFGENSVGYLSVYMSGSTPVDHDVTVTLRPASHLLKEYNQRVNGSVYANYAELLPESAYTVPDGWTTTITPANSYTMFPISVNVDQLDLSKTYYLPIEIASVSDYQYSATKNYVLFRIYVKNAYATTKSSTYYQMYGTTLDLKADGESLVKVDEEAVPTVFNATKLTVPLSENDVRILPGSTQSSEVAVVNQRSIRVTVTDEVYQNPVLGDDGLPTGQTIPVLIVKVEPLNVGSGCVQVRTAYDIVTGEEQVSFYNPADNTFTLNYTYRMPSEKSGSADLWHKVHEELSRLN